ncbi:hypothetical protein CVT24_006310 [Panaeolus cyanescens]|uniref:ABC transporter domain-containing protein n=1 Tax=Panaeolus cyanescens TaxID=181874 RepID=A0A409YEB6_9AGAR|nr:hypothetical protein CVT24_006310 [Panaeolus cyanescens]
MASASTSKAASHIPFLRHPLPIPESLNRRPLVLAFLVFLLLRSRAVTLSKDAINALGDLPQKLKSRKKKLTEEELSRVLQQVYLEKDVTPEEEADGVRKKTLLVPYRGGVVKVPIESTPLSKFKEDAPYFPPLSVEQTLKPSLSLEFLAQLRAILFRIAIPSISSSETGIVALHSTFLVLRTVLSILVARLDGRIVRDIVKADGKAFLRGLGLWFLLAIPSTITNSMIRHLQSLLALRLRTRLTRYLHDLYLSANPDLRYYRATNYLEGIDQYLTADVEAWSNAMSGLYGNLLKPSLDMLLFTSQLSRSLGVRGTILLFANYYATAAILRAATPAFGKLAATEARLEGEYRKGMGRVGREAEEVAFYNGGAREKDILTNAYLKLIKHVNYIYKIRIAYEWTEDYVIKYLWSAAGYALIAVPILFTRTKRALQGIKTTDAETRKRDDAVAGRTESYISNRRLLLSLADAGGRLMYAYKDLLELAGLTTRLYTLLSTLLNLKKGYVPLVIEGAPEIKLANLDVRVPRGRTDPEKALEEKEKAGEQSEKSSSAGDNEDAPLVKDLNLTIKVGEHLMITGSNGVGKTAVARVLGGLWDPAGDEPRVEMPRDAKETADFFAKGRLVNGSLERPRPTLYVLPQRSYMTVGSLLEQIIYPCSFASFVKYAEAVAPLQPPPAGSRLNLPVIPRDHPVLVEIYDILEKVFLAYVVEREGGLSVRKEWRDVLSGGEKQRMGMARVLWWRPRFAVLDECTSAVSSDVEGRMYESAKALDITLITISLRPSLMKYHTQLLTLEGPGGGASLEDGSDAGASSSHGGKWTLSRVGSKEERMGVDREIAVLESKLAEVEGWEQRVKELEGLLGVQDLDEGNVGEKEVAVAEVEAEAEESIEAEAEVSAVEASFISTREAEDDHDVKSVSEGSVEQAEEEVEEEVVEEDVTPQSPLEDID